MLNAFRQNIVPPSDMHPASWAAKHVFVENSERGAMFDPSQTRWWIKPMGCYADYKTKNMVCIMPTGAGKSTFFEAIMCWIIAQQPGSVLYASQTDPDAKKWMKTRLIKTLRRCKPLDHLWLSNLRNSVTDELIILIHMFISSGGANMSNLQSQSITYGMSDEGHVWKKGMTKEWLARSHNRENRKFTMVSQAGKISLEGEPGDSCDLHLEHDQCRKWDFGWKCDRCGNSHPFTFDQLKYDEQKRGNGTIDDQASADTTRRTCPNETCGKEFDDTAITRRMLHDSLRENDGYILTSDNGLRGYEGFHLDRGGMWWCSWSDDVLKKINADRQKAIGDHTMLAEWTMKDRALGWSDSQACTTITMRHSGYTKADYEEARLIDGETFRFCAIDAGGDHFWMAIRAFSEGGSSRLLYFAYVPTAADCDKIREQYGVKPELTFLDVGFEQERMAGIIADYGWQGVKGDGNRKSGWEWEIKAGPKKGQKETRLYSKPWHAKAKDGRRAKCWHLCTTQLQYILQRLIDGQGAEWLAYDDAPPTYAKHLNGERLIAKKDARGRDVEEWTRTGANHGRDCENYLLAAALMFRAFAAVGTA